MTPQAKHYLQELKSHVAITSVPWASNESSWNSTTKITNEAQAYARVPLIFRALRLRCNSLLRVPLYVKDLNDSEEVLDEYAFEDTLKLRDFLWLSEAALLLQGAAYNLKLTNRFQQAGVIRGIKGLQWLNPFTMQTQYTKGELYLWQQLFTGERFPANGGFWTLDDFLYLKEFNPTDDIGAGISATQVALGGAQISNNMTQFLANFFGSDAVPVTMVVLGKNTAKTEVARVENWFKERIRKLRASILPRVIALTSDIKIEKLTPELKSFEFEKIDSHAEDNVAHAFDIPKSVLLGEGANRAETEAHYRAFLDTTIIPRCRYYEQMLNPLLEPEGQKIEFAPEEMPEYQVEESERSDSLGKLITAGVPLLAALDILGFDISENSMKLIEDDLKKKEKQKTQIPVVGNRAVNEDGEIVNEPQPVNIKLDIGQSEAGKSVSRSIEIKRDEEGRMVGAEILDTLKSTMRKTNGT